MIITDWKIINYEDAWRKQEKLFQTIIDRKRAKLSTCDMETIFLCEHPHVFTLGKGGNIHNLLVNEAFLKKIGATYFHIDRGGDITYHGYGQLVGYPILDIENHQFSLKGYIHNLEESIIRTLAEYNIMGERLKGATGVWLDSHSCAARKIAAIGVRASRFVTMHGFALNINTDLTYFNYINPCGFTDKGVTSMEKELGQKLDLNEIKNRMAFWLLELLQ